MFGKLSRTARLFLLALLAGSFLFGAPRPAGAQEEGFDILFNVVNGKFAIVPKDPDTPLEKLLNRTMENPFGDGFLNDTGFDVAPGFDAEPPYDDDSYLFSQLTIQQVSISDGLTAIYQFDGVTKVFGPADQGYRGTWTLSEDKLFEDQISAGPGSKGKLLYFHQHFDFAADAPGDYYFTFKIVNAKDLQGNPLPDSDVFSIHYIADAT